MSPKKDLAAQVAKAYLEYRSTVRNENYSHDDVYWAKEKLEHAANVYEATLTGSPLAVIPPE